VAYSSVGAVRQALAPSLIDPDQEPQTQTGTAANVSNETISDAIAEADSRIDTYISGRYSTPVPTDQSGKTPAPINFWSRDLAAYLVLLTWRKNQNVDADDPVRLRATQVATDLVAVRDGKAHLPLPPNQTGTGQEAGALPAINLGYSGNLFEVGEFDVFGSPWPRSRVNELNGRWHDWWPV
jgi:phage gp36-like protein